MQILKPKFPTAKILKQIAKKSSIKIDEFDIQGETFRANKNGNFDMTLLWKLSGEDSNKKPSEWIRWEPSKKFIKIIKDLQVKTGDRPPLVESKKGRYGGTFAHPQILLAYAQWLSPKFHAEVNEIFLRVKSGDLELINEILESHVLQNVQKGIDKWGIERTRGKLARVRLTGAMWEHGVDSPYGFAFCTNSLYTGALGRTAPELKARKHLHSSESLRDNMPFKEVGTISIGETLAVMKIEENKSDGMEDCARECYVAGDLARQIANINTKKIVPGKAFEVFKAKSRRSIK